MGSRDAKGLVQGHTVSGRVLALWGQGPRPGGDGFWEGCRLAEAWVPPPQPLLSR